MRNPRPRIVVLIGLPGAGKSAYVARNGLPALSSDAIRRLLADDEDNQTIHRQVFSTLRYLLVRRLRLGRPLTCIDATNLTPSERRPYLAIGRRYGCDVEAIFFDIPVEVCRERNRRRRRRAPDAVIETMAARLVPPSSEEGFSRIRVIRD